jgi:hypothetical protein
MGKKQVAKIFLVFIAIGFLLSYSMIAFADINNGIIAYYPFNGNALDASGNGYNGTVYGATSTEDRFGNANSAYYFDGNSYIGIPTLFPYTSSAFTLSANIKMTNIVNNDYGNFNMLLGLQGNASLQLINGYPNFSLKNQYGDSYQITSANSVTINKYTQIDGVYQKGEMSLYVDGKLTKSVQIPNADLFPGAYGSHPSSIGAHAQMQYSWHTLNFNGAIDDVRVYNRALSSTEIMTLASSTIAPIKPDVIQTNRIPNPTLIAAPQKPDNSQLKLSNQLDPVKDTIVLTHGWNPGDANSADFWPRIMAQAYNSNPDIKNVNIFYWDWTKAAQTGVANFSLANGMTYAEGKQLGEALLKTLGNNYTGKIHFIGHSLGSQVNATAIDYLVLKGYSGDNIHDTVFDGAEPDMISTNKVFPTSQIKLIDNYISQFGNLSDRAINVILQQKPKDLSDIVTPVSNHSYPQEWYTRTIYDSTINGPHLSIMGNSLSLGGYDINPTLYDRYYAQLNRYLPFIDEWNLIQISKLEALGFMSEHIIAHSIIRGSEEIWEVFKENLYIINSCGDVSADVATGQLVLLLREHSPAYSWLNFKVPNNINLLSFAFAFNGFGDNDYLTFGINDELLYQMYGKYMENGIFMNTGYIDISKWAGQNVELFFGLNSDGISGGELSIRNINFAHYQTPEPTTIMLLGLGLIGLAAVRRKFKN